MTLLIYIDNILLTSDSLDIMNKTKKFLRSKVEIKDIEESAYVLGIRIIREIKSNILYLN